VATASALSGSEAFHSPEPTNVSVGPHRTGFDRNRERCYCHDLPLIEPPIAERGVYAKPAKPSIVGKFNSLAFDGAQSWMTLRKI
jgi:hypothetical protein